LQYKNESLFASLMIMFCLSLPVHSAESQPVMGAGPSTAVATLFFKYFSPIAAEYGYRFSVEQRSIKQKGGIKASGEYLFGRIGRPLNMVERAGHKHELFLASNRIAIVIGNSVGIKRISKKELEGIFTRKITNWSSLGGVDKPIMLVGREVAEALFGVIKKDYPFFTSVTFDRIFTRDHQVVNFIKSEMGRYAISFGARANYTDQHILEVDGLNSAVNVGLVYDEKNMNHPIVNAAKKFVQSDKWHHILHRYGFLPPR